MTKKLPSIPAKKPVVKAKKPTLKKKQVAEKDATVAPQPPVSAINAPSEVAHEEQRPPETLNQPEPTHVPTPVGLIPIRFWKDVAAKCNIWHRAPEGSLPSPLDWFVCCDEELEYRGYRVLIDCSKAKNKVTVTVLKNLCESEILKQYLADFQGDDAFEFFLQDKYPSTRNKAIARIKANIQETSKKTAVRFATKGVGKSELTKAFDGVKV